MHAAALFGVLAFWCGLGIAGELYPGQYDWRYMTISSLLYPDRNPHGYRWAWGGVAVCGLGGLCWVAALISNRRLEKAADGPGGIWALGLGYVCMVLCALLPARFLHVPRSHDILALSAFLGVCVGTVRLTYLAVDERLLRRELSAYGPARLYAATIAGAALLPIVLMMVTQAYVAHALPRLPWVGLEWREQGIPAYLSFAFWEWVTCLVLSLYISALSILKIPKWSR